MFSVFGFHAQCATVILRINMHWETAIGKYYVYVSMNDVVLLLFRYATMNG